MNTLTPTQAAIVADPSPVRVVIATAGSGKTAVLAEAIHFETLCADDLAGIVALTFTVAAGEELRSRLPVAIGFVGTLHSFVVRYLHQRGKTFAIMSEAEDKAEVDRIAGELRYKGGKEALRELIRLGPQKHAVGEIGLVAKEYWTRQFKSRLLSFDGLLWYGLKTMRAEGPPAVSMLFVDEAQDSTTVDGLIYDELRAPRMMIVGDPDQQVFSFRGGSMAWLMDMARRHGHTALEENHRSGLAICEAATRLIGHNSGRIEKRTVSARGTPGAVTVRVFERERDEFAFVVEMLKGNLL